MATFRSVQRQLPDIWIKQRGAATTRQMQLRYNLRTEGETLSMLEALVRERRLVRREIDGVTMWDVPRRTSSG